MTNYINNGTVNLAEFYMGSNGWPTPIAQWDVSELTTVMITNETADFVTFTVNQEGMGQYTSPPIPPFQSGNFTWNNGGQDGSSTVAVLDYWQTWLGGFEPYQHDDDKLIFSNQWSIKGYQFSPAVIGNTNSDPKGYMSTTACQIAIQPAT
jgi:hypothetical protein